jgi:hypothetical protein
MQTRETVSSTVGYRFILPATLPADFSGITYLVEKDGEDTYAQAQWSVGEGLVIFRMVPHDADIGNIEEGYDEGYYEYEMTAGTSEVECVADSDGIYAASWADSDYDYLIVSDRALSDGEVTAMATSLS